MNVAEFHHSLCNSDNSNTPTAAQSSTIFVGQTLLEWTEGIGKQEETINYWRETEYLNCQAPCNNGKSAFAYPILI